MIRGRTACTGPPPATDGGCYKVGARAILLARLMAARTPLFALSALTRAFCLGLSALK